MLLIILLSSVFVLLMISNFSKKVCLNYYKYLIGVLFSEGGSADYIVTGAWSAKAVKEVNYKKKKRIKKFEEVVAIKHRSSFN